MEALNPRGLRNNNPLNIRVGNNWLGERTPKTDKDFEEFETIELGCRAAVICIRTYIKKHKWNTPRLIISHWDAETAPRYLDAVLRITHYHPDKPIRFEEKGKVCFLLWAMAQVECGQVVPLHHFEKGYAMAIR